MFKQAAQDANKIRHVIVVSYDAFSRDNWESASVLPHMAELISSGVHCNALKSVDPTLTYVVHTTMMTGVRPARHGIAHNNPLQPFVPEDDQAWYWFRSQIKVPTLYDALRDKGLTTASILWPVTGRGRITWNLPEVKAVGRENQYLKVLRNGNPIFCLDMVLRYGHLRKGIQEPELDDFSTACAIDTIKRRKPALLLLHLIDLDEAKHGYGTGSSEVQDAIGRMDIRLGQIVQAAREAGIWEQTAIVVLGDHGQFDVHRIVKLNDLLLDAGLISQSRNQIQWRAYVQSAKGSAYLHVKAGDEEGGAMAFEALKRAAADESFGIESITETNDSRATSHGTTILCRIEAKKGFSFSEELGSPVVVNLDEIGLRYATHGYSPEKDGYRCNFIVAGPGIRQGSKLPDMEMVDVAPTLAAMLGVKMKNTDGRVLEEIFE